MSIVRIREFDPVTQLRPLAPTDTDGVKILIIGRPGMGKSYVMKALLYAKRHILPCAIAFSGTELTTSAWGKIIPPTFVYDYLDTAALERALDRQTELINGKEKDENLNPWLGIILDDVCDDKTTLRHQVFRTIFKNGRHHRIFCVMSMQFVKDAPVDLRNNADFVLMFREPSVLTRKKLFEDFGSVLGDFATFNLLMDTLTTDHTCLVFDNTKPRENFEDCVFWYKAPVVPDFTVGSNDFWRYHHARTTKS